MERIGDDNLAAQNPGIMTSRRMKAAVALPQSIRSSKVAKLNDINPQSWLAFVLAKLPDHPAKAIDELLPWN
jgi:IS66 C-terminal element